MGKNKAKLIAQQKKSPSKIVLSKRVIEKSFSGPLPPPDAMEKYEQICPGAAHRILTMAENQSSHRINIENTVTESVCNESKQGQHYALTTNIVTIISGCLTAFSGEAVAGIIIGISGPLCIGSVSLYNLRKEKKFS